MLGTFSVCISLPCTSTLTTAGQAGTPEDEDRVVEDEEVKDEDEEEDEGEAEDDDGEAEDDEDEEIGIEEDDDEDEDEEIEDEEEDDEDELEEDDTLISTPQSWLNVTKTSWIGGTHQNSQKVGELFGSTN